MCRERGQARLVQQDPRVILPLILHVEVRERGSEIRRADHGVGAWGRHVVGWRATMREDGKWAQGGCWGNLGTAVGDPKRQPQKSDHTKGGREQQGRPVQPLKNNKRPVINTIRV